MSNPFSYLTVIAGLLAAVPLQADEPAAPFAPMTPEASSEELAYANVYQARACAAPGYGAYPLQAGCPQCGPPCCNDVWAGYCHERKFGSGFRRGVSHRSVAVPCGTAPTCASCQPEVQPLPPISGAPLAPPMKQPPALRPLPPAPTIPAAPQSAIPPKAPEMPGEKPAGSAGANFPVFDPSAWKIGQSAK